MKTVFIEADDESEFNWGKFMVGKFTPDELIRRSALPANAEMTSPMLRQIGFDPLGIYVCDLQTGEGSWFHPSKHSPKAGTFDLDKHQIWVCPMFEPFLNWLYQQDTTTLDSLDKLPNYINLGKVPTAMSGYRRQGAKKRAKEQNTAVHTAK